MTLREILKAEEPNGTDSDGWILAEKLYATIHSPRAPAALAHALQRIMNTMQHNHIRYPPILLRRRAQLIGRARDGSRWTPEEAERLIELPKPAPTERTEKQIVAEARKTLTPEEFARWVELRQQAAILSDTKSSVIEMGRKRA